MKAGKVRVDTWEWVKARTAAEGAVWRSNDRSLFKRTGGAEVCAEARFQGMLADQGFPVPEIVEAGEEKGRFFFIEQSVGEESLHDIAVRDTKETGTVRQSTLDTAAEISVRLLTAQTRTARREPGEGTDWVRRAGFIDNVFAENPDLDTDRIRKALAMVSERLHEVPAAYGHLDYGLPNAFRNGVIDWQHHALVPVGFDVYPMLDITAFKGGGKGYTFTREQRQSYITTLDKASRDLMGFPLSCFLGDFLLVKCFFFLALMRPKDTADQRRQTKWAYRRKLFILGAGSYGHDRRIDTGSFPTLSSFLADHGQ